MIFDTATESIFDTATETTTTRTLGYCKTAAGARAYIKREGVELAEIVQMPVPTVFGGFAVVEHTLVCKRSGAVPAKCCCSAHANI